MEVDGSKQEGFYVSVHLELPFSMHFPVENQALKPHITHTSDNNYSSLNNNNSNTRNAFTNRPLSTRNSNLHRFWTVRKVSSSLLFLLWNNMRSRKILISLLSFWQGSYSVSYSKTDETRRNVNKCLNTGNGFKKIISFVVTSLALGAIYLLV